MGNNFFGIVDHYKAEYRAERRARIAAAITWLAAFAALLFFLFVWLTGE